MADRPDVQAWFAPLACARSTACAMAERAVSRALGGSCQVPLAAYARETDGQLDVRALVAEPDGSRVLRAQAQGPMAQAEALGLQVAQALMAQGADAILARLQAASEAPGA